MQRQRWNSVSYKSIWMKVNHKKNLQRMTKSLSYLICNCDFICISINLIWNRKVLNCVCVSFQRKLCAPYPFFVQYCVVSLVQWIVTILCICVWKTTKKKQRNCILYSAIKCVCKWKLRRSSITIRKPSHFFFPLQYLLLFLFFIVMPYTSTVAYDGWWQDGRGPHRRAPQRKTIAYFVFVIIVVLFFVLLLLLFYLKGVCFAAHAYIHPYVHPSTEILLDFTYSIRFDYLNTSISGSLRIDERVVYSRARLYGVRVCVCVRVYAFKILFCIRYSVWPFI